MSNAQPEKKPNVYGNLPTNSKKSRAEKPELKKIISGDVVQQKKSLGKRIAESFTGDDSRTVGSYVLFDVILPAAKQLISDAATQAVERLLFGGSTGASGGPRRSYTAYNRYGAGINSNRQSVQTVPPKVNPRAVHNFDDIVLESRSAVEEVIDALSELVSTYGVATVADLYELVGITGSYTDDKWGWTSMVGARAEMVRGGYLIFLPKTEALE